MSYSIRILTVVLSILWIASIGQAETPERQSATVTYIASEGIYIDAGRSSGLEVGDTLIVSRSGERVARIVVTNVSSQSAAAQAVDQTMPIEVGDLVRLPSQPAFRPEQKEPKRPRQKTPSKPDHSGQDRTDRLRGHVTLGTTWHTDMTGSSRRWLRPALRAKLTVPNVAGTSLKLSWRHSTRLYHRATTLGSGHGTNEWSHQVYELSLSSGSKKSETGTVWALGRVLAPQVRGMGYIDGGYYTIGLGERYQVGIAGGAVPDMRTSGVRTSRNKIGIFAVWKTDNKDTWRLDVSAALSGEYESGELSREFLYLQSAFMRGRWLSWFQSVEVDYNRGWRFAQAGSRLDISSYYSSARFLLHRKLSLQLSWDSRKQVRYFEVRDLPDTLFDNRSRRGLKTGFRYTVSNRLMIRGSSSFRFRDGPAVDNKVYSISTRISRFPVGHHSMTFSVTRLVTQFTSGYRPVLMYRLPVRRRMSVNIMAAAHFYKTGTIVTRNYYLDINSSYTFGRRYYLYGGARQYFDKDLRSLELFAELGFDI